MSERRLDKRHPIELAITLMQGNDLSIHASHNLSLGGVFFAQVVPYPVGTLVKARFELPGDTQTIECDAQVVSVTNGGMGMGVKWMRLSDEDSLRIERFVKSISHQ